MQTRSIYAFLVQILRLMITMRSTFTFFTFQGEKKTISTNLEIYIIIRT